MPNDLSEQEKKILKNLFIEANKLQQEFQKTVNPIDHKKSQTVTGSINTSGLIELYVKYYETYLKYNETSNKILQQGLLKIKNNPKQTLNNQEIIELHRNLGIRFDKDGNILKIDYQSSKLGLKILENTKKIWNSLNDNTYNQLLKKYPDLPPYANNVEEEFFKDKSFLPFISNIFIRTILQTTDKFDDFIEEYSSLDNSNLFILMNKLRNSLNKPLLDIKNINLLFQELYNYLGIKYFIQVKDNKVEIRLQKIKFNSLLLSDDIPWEHKKYNLHFNNNDGTLYATRSMNLPLEESETKKLLGKGAFGKVNTAFQEDQNNIKTIAHKKIQGVDEINSSIMNELETLEKLYQGQISSKLDVTKKLHMIMPFHEGKTLNSTDSLALNLQERIELMQTLGSKIEDIHKMGIKHNDLKGSNIIVDYQNKIIELIDFGIIEKDISLDNPPAYETKGTPTYMAPEMINTDLIKQSENDPRFTLKTYFASDIYSLGKILINDAGLHTLGIAYKMTKTSPIDRPNIDEYLEALKKYKENIEKIKDLEFNIASVIDLSNKVNLIVTLFEKYDICSEKYYDTLIKVLQAGSKEDLEKMQQIPVFDHLFQVDPTALRLKVYEHSSAPPLENKILELFTEAKNNPKFSKEMTFMLINHICNNLKDNTELWCNSALNMIPTCLNKNVATAEFVKNYIGTYLEEKKQELDPKISQELNSIMKSLSQIQTQTFTNDNSDDESVGGSSKNSDDYRSISEISENGSAKKNSTNHNNRSIKH